MKRLAAVLLTVFASPTALAAPCAGFTDVDDSSGFCVNVEWMKNRGITLGITPTLYGPNAPVTRLQMAVFMYRLGFQNALLRGGNAYGAPAVLGTIDDQAVEVIANNARVMRYEPSAISPNVIGGSPANGVRPGAEGVTISGGGGIPLPFYRLENQVTGSYGTVGGGRGNHAGNNNSFDFWTTIAGGNGNTALSQGSSIGGGESNRASGPFSTVGGGSGNTASGGDSTVAGGRGNIAAGDGSFAAGHFAMANGHGSFTWADSSSFHPFGVPDANFFAVRATGGVGFTVAINGSGGGTQFCDLRPGTVGWICVSDRDAKENFEEVDSVAALEKLAAMPVYSWSFKDSDPALRNIGPTAQDFHAAFGLGNNDKVIAGSNLQGVALAAIQGLNAKVERQIAAKDGEIAALRAELATIRSALASITKDRATKTAELVP